MKSKTDVCEALQRLVGLQLSIMRNAAATKTIQFGSLRPHPNGRGTVVGQYALHISCAWRIISPLGIVTGSSDRYEHPSRDKDFDEKDWLDGNLQARKLLELLGGSDAHTGGIMNTGQQLIVTAVNAHECGAIDISLSGHYVLQVFPDGSSVDTWRLFVPGDKTSHFVFP